MGLGTEDNLSSIGDKCGGFYDYGARSGSGGLVLESQDGYANDELSPGGDFDLFTTHESGNAPVMDVPRHDAYQKYLVDPDSKEEFLSQSEGEGMGNPEILMASMMLSRGWWSIRHLMRCSLALGRLAMV